MSGDSTPSSLQAIAASAPQPGLSPDAIKERKEKKQTQAEAHTQALKEIKGQLKKQINELGHKLPQFRRDMKTHQSSLGKKQLPEDLAHLENLDAFLAKQQLDLNEKYNPDYLNSESRSIKFEAYQDKVFTSLSDKYLRDYGKLSEMTIDSEQDSIAPLLEKDFQHLTVESAQKLQATWKQQVEETEKSFDVLCKYRELLAVKTYLQHALINLQPPQKEAQELLPSLNQTTANISLKELNELLEKAKKTIDRISAPVPAELIASAPIRFKPAPKDEHGNSKKFKELDPKETFSDVFKKRTQFFGGPKWTSHSHKAGQAENDKNNYNHLTYSSSRKNRSFHFEAKDDHLAASAGRKELTAAKKDWDQCPPHARVKAINVMMRTYLLTTDLMAEKLRQLDTPDGGKLHNIRLEAVESNPKNPVFDEKNAKVCEAFQCLMTAHLNQKHSDREASPHFLINGETSPLAFAKGKDILMKDLGLTEKEFDHVNQLVLDQAKKQKSLAYQKEHPLDKPVKGQKDSAKENQQNKRKFLEDTTGVQKKIEETTPSQLKPWKR